ncbi:MAG: FAD-dependent oxidoreductase [Candidatus Tectomicrobia bacterium]|uniref:FAD-dependent oxidoreductase n=1 Tax=Tectimicrobiota bacterium TaxID=2528274 RepID=A0A932GMY9_UNCTE|nr:FAD-dependent oxidoreductase [Candidatus Tectomicrobia bacterium]
MPVIKKVRKLGGLSGIAAGPGARATSPLRPQFVLKTPPCSDVCPNHTDIRAVLTNIAQAETHGKSYDQAFEQAFYIIAERNPLPAVCGRVCPHPCEEACNRNHLDAPASINCLERFIGDFALEKGFPLRRLSEDRLPEKIAVIGSGPSGLSCSYQLARRGYPVTVFEAFPKPGGMLRYGIPTYRLPRQILDAEIARILALGVELRCETMVGKDVPYEDLRQVYAAIFVGIGAHRGLSLGVPGDEAPNVLSGVEFLHRVNAGERPDVGKTVVVVGGGDTAVDAARAAARLGAKTTILYRRTIQEMPAIRQEVEEAKREGIQIEFLAAPSAVATENGCAVGLTCLRMELGEPDASGRRRPVPIPGSEFYVGASTIIAAISQEPDFTGLESFTAERGGIPVDDRGETTVPGAFAGGDVLELGIVTTAIFHGRRAAEVIHSRLRGTPVESAPAPPVITYDRMRLDYYPKQPRTEMERVPVDERLQDPDREVNLGLTREQVIAEAKRCLSCGLCSECDNCWKYCQDQAVIKPFEKGQPYRFKLEFCQGCKKCAEECPCGYIEMV